MDCANEMDKVHGCRCECVGSHKNVNKLCTDFENLKHVSQFSTGNPKMVPLVLGKVSEDLFL